MAMVGHKTESIYRRYAIVDAGTIKAAAARIDQAAEEQGLKTGTPGGCGEGCRRDPKETEEGEGLLGQHKDRDSPFHKDRPALFSLLAVILLGQPLGSLLGCSGEL